MKTRMVKLRRGDPCVAVLENDTWVPLKLLTEDVLADCSIPPQATESVIAFLSLDERQRANLANRLTSVWPQAARLQSEILHPMMPFQPLSCRDFMLYERHAIDAARGYAKRFLPMAYRVARLYEVASRRPSPAFRPGMLWYAQPLYYMGNHLSFLPSEAVVPWPRYTQALDYELELGVVVVRPLFNATPEEAEQAIGGFTVFNDFSAPRCAACRNAHWLWTVQGKALRERDFRCRGHRGCCNGEGLLPQSLGPHQRQDGRGNV